jgi:type I restriction enzyme R subunit
MPATDTSERGLESLIVASLTSGPALREGIVETRIGERPPPGYVARAYVQGNPHDYDRVYAVDPAKLVAFLKVTQPVTFEQLQLGEDGLPRQRFLDRLSGEIAKHGIVGVLRNGVKHGPASVDLFYGTPDAKNVEATIRFSQNIFSVTRQLRYSADDQALALDLAIFINGLPVATFELKNSLTKQTVADAEQQYRRDRDPNELLFQFGRCLAHFAVDDAEVRFCTKLDGKASWFLPFNRGWNDGAGNPPNPDGLKTAYLWEEVLTREGLADIIENYAQMVEEKHERGKARRYQIFPRYHQLDVVRKLLTDAGERGTGRRYLIQHSAGSGKSNSIAWLAHQLVGLEREGARVFDSIIVVTDRRVLDKQLRDTIKQFAQVSSVIGAVTEGSQQLRQFIESGKKIIITTVQKFPVIVEDLGKEHRDRTFAILIDEAHSSQGGRTAADMNRALAPDGTEEDDETFEDQINRVMTSRKMLTNASYFAFTATPKHRTLEIFGEPYEEGGQVKHRPFHSYTMKQAIQEGFILDVLNGYTPVDSYYRLAKKVEDDPEFDTRRAQKKLRHYVEAHDRAIRTKAEIMVDHFHDKVIAARMIGGEARAMVVTGSIARAVDYFHAFEAYLRERKSPYRAIVAFSREHEFGGKKETEASLNGFPSNLIPEKFRQDPYRFLICAEKFQTGYDEPLLHTMYVDKPLSGIKAVQTLSRLNRAHPKKHNTFVLDFQNDADTIEAAFSDYYRTTILSAETDPNRLHDLKADLDGYQVYSAGDVDTLVQRYLAGAERPQLDIILDACVGPYLELDEDGQVDFKGKARAFVRTYGFLASILDFNNAEWEKLATFLNFLIPKLPAPKEEDLSKGILEAIDMDSYRVEVKAAIDITLPDADAEIEPMPAAGGGHKPEPELDRLSNIIRAFNEQFGNVDWDDRDRIERVITQEIPPKLAEDRAYQNAMKNSDRQNARIEHDRALGRVITSLVKDDTQLYKKFWEDESFRRWLQEAMFGATYQGGNSS